MMSMKAVLVDGMDVRDVTLESLRSQMGVMLQDTFIFSGTIIKRIFAMEN